MSRGRLLITGASGFIGRPLTHAAVAAGFETHALGRREPPSQAVWHRVDLLAEPQETTRLIADLRPTHLMHAAWCTAHSAYWRSDDNLLWLAATAAMAHAFVQAGGQRLVMAGTCAEYAWSQEQEMLHEEQTPARPATPYGVCKLAAYQALQSLNEGHPGFTTATGRIFFVYGPHEEEARIVPYVCRSLARGEPALLSSGTQVRDFLHVDDAATGFLALLCSDVTGAVNVASGQATRLADIARLIGAVSGREDLVRLGARPDRPDDSCRLVADVAKLRALGWAPRRSLEHGLKDAYDWWHSMVPP